MEINNVTDINDYKMNFLYRIRGVTLDNAFKFFRSLKKNMGALADRKIKKKDHKVDKVIDDGSFINTSNITTTNSVLISLYETQGDGGYLRIFAGSRELPRYTGMRTRRRKGKVYTNSTGKARRYAGVLKNINSMDNTLAQVQEQYKNELQNVINNGK